MRLNDPFGRLQRRDEAGYDTVKTALRQAGVRDRAAARQVIARTRTRVLTFIAIVCTALVPVLLLWPRLLPIALALTALAVAVAANALIKARQHVQRYMDEEIDAG